jgi:hypothetical protein
MLTKALKQLPGLARKEKALSKKINKQQFD